MADHKAGGNSGDPRDKLFEAFKLPIKIRNLADPTHTFNLEVKRSYLIPSRNTTKAVKSGSPST